MGQPYHLSQMQLQRVFLVIMLALVSFFSRGQEEIHSEWNTINYSLKDGLPSNETYDVFQDSKGFIWIATDNGVARYNGNEFRTFTTLDGLSDNTVFKITEDDKGRIWFLTYNREISYYEDGSFHLFPHNEILISTIEKNTIMTNEIITDFFIDSHGNYHFTLINFTIVVISEKGEIWMENIEKRPEFVEYHFTQTTLPDLTLELQKHLKEYPNFTKFIVGTDEWEKVHIIRTTKGTYLSTPNGIHLISETTKAISAPMFTEFYITGATYDFEGGMWLSTLKNGVLYVPNPNLIHFKTSKKQSIRTILPQTDLLIFPLHKNGAQNLFLDTVSQSLKFYPYELEGELIPENVLHKGLRIEKQISFKNMAASILGLVHTSQNGIIYFSNHKYHYQLRLADKEVSQLNLSDFSLTYLHEQNEYWYIQKGSHFDYKANDLSVANYSATFPIPFKILKPLALKNGTILLATTQGLFEINSGDLKISPSRIKHPVTSKRIEDIIETNNQTLVFGIKGKGIYLWSKNEMINLTQKDGLLSNQVYQLEYDSITNTIWVGTNNGFSKLGQQKNGTWSTEALITSYDGLESQEVRSFAFYQNVLVFSNSKGLNLIPKEALKPFSIAPKLWLDQIQVNNNPYPIKNQISLPYDSNSLSISVHSISFKSRKNRTLKYQLLPNDSLWISTSGDQVNLASLAPGEYTLNLKTENYAGINSNLKTIQIEIVPAFWMTWWFYAIITTAGIFVVYYLSRKSIQIYKNQAKFQRSLKEMHVVSLQSKMNPHFIFNSLNSIQNYILKNERLKANEYLLEFSSLIRAILQNSESTSISLLKELETLRMYVALEKKRIRKDFEYIETIDSKLELSTTIIPTLLIQPYIENAIWHGKVYTNPKGLIEVKIKKLGNTLFFEISDNGIGIENAEKTKVRPKGYKSIGSEATKKRIQLLSELNNDITEVKISKRDSKNKEFPGTVITFSVPYKNSNTQEV